MRVPNGHRARRYLLALALACAGLLCAAPGAFAVGLTVDSLGDSEDGNCSPTASCTLREAINLVIEGEDEPGEGISGDVTIEFDDDVEGTIEIEEELDLIFGEGVESLTILGPGRSVVKINGKGTTRIFRTYEGEVKISGLTLENGHVGGFALDGDGGAGLFVNGGDITVEDVRFTANTIDGERGGAAIDVEEGNLTVLDSQIDHNSTDANVEGSGGGINIDSSGSTVTVVNTEITDNTTDVGQGGGIYQDEGNLLVENSLIADNKVGTGNVGGGIGAEQDGAHTTTIVGSTIVGNDAADFGYGGGVWTKPGSGGVTIENSTIAGNTAMVAGGVMVLGPTTIDTTTIAANNGGGVGVAGETTIHASTIVGNEVEAGAGGGINEEGEYEVKVRSTIVAGNKEAGGPSDCAGDITSEGNNILGFEPDYCEWTPAAGDQLGVDPKLGELADNGGPTMTVAPISASSPAINHGSFPNFEDQRGKARPVPEGNPADTDVGAVEVQAPVNESLPSISYEGDLAAGTELTCEAGEWDTDTVTEFEPSYSWLVAGDPVASTQTYTPGAEDAESAITCVETVDTGPESKAAESEAVEFAAGELSISPGGLDFGIVNVGYPNWPEELTVTNVGAAPVTVTKAESSDQTHFPVVGHGCEGDVLAPGGECTVEVRFEPSQGGGYDAAIAVLSDAPTISADVYGTGNEAVVSFSPASHDFGSRRVDSGAGDPKVFELTNESDGPVRLGFAGVRTEGPEAAQFVAPGPGDECSEKTLEAGESCSVEVLFEPTAPGPASAELEISSEAPDATAELSGTGTHGEITISPSSFDFGPRGADTGPSARQVFEIASSGNEAVTLGELEVSGEFELPEIGNLCDGMTLQPTEKCTVEVFFEPLTVGVKSGILSVPSDIPTATASLTGIGVIAAAFAANPPDLAFGAHEVATTTSQAVTISNQGEMPASVDSVAIVGTDAAAFELPAAGEGCSGEELEPGESCSVEVAFSPGAAGSAEATLELTGGAPALMLPLSGTGVDKPAPPPPPPPPAAPSASLLNPGRVSTGPSGAAPLSLGCTSPGGSSCQVSVTLLSGATALGSWSGPLAAGSNGLVEVPLSGAARKQLAARGLLSVEAVVGVAGGSGASAVLTLVAPPAPTLKLKSAQRAGDSVRFKLSCGGFAARCQGGLKLSAKSGAKLASGKVSLAKGGGEKTLALTAAGRRLLETEPAAQLVAELTTKDPVYMRTTATKKKLRLGP